MKLSSLEYGRRIALFVLLGLLAALLVGVFLTRGGDPSLAYNAPPVLPNTSGLVDQKPLQTARDLAAQAATPQERAFATQALQAADHEVDQAFATALRDATTNAPPLSGWALTYSKRIAAMTDKVNAEQQHINDLKQALPAASNQDQATAQLGLAQAQLELDNDELADLHQDLIRVDGDRAAKIQQAMDEHAAVQKRAESIPENTPTTALESPEALRTLPGKIRALLSLNGRHKQLWQARLDAFALAATLTRQHDDLEKQLEESSQTPASPSNSPTPAADSPSGSARTSSPNKGAAALGKLKEQTLQRQRLTEWSTRIRNEQALAMAYENWDHLVVAQRRTVLNRIVQTLTVVTTIVLLVVLSGILIRSLSRGGSVDQRRLIHLRIIAELAVQAVGLIVILLVIFGLPRQTPTIIGLATAGLTVVLKDFIVAFFGWFVLMGRNGMRIGDWVEINGVGGEVVEIGLMRTVLLETGSFAEMGHPTGRRITFLNSFAIEGTYFNFSTAGQWLWDQLQVTVPPSAESYQKVDQIRAAVAKTTEANAREAEAEWKKATRNYPAPEISAQAAVDLRPVPEGIAVTVRYITRAPERYAMRTRLYHDVIGILHEGPVPELTAADVSGLDAPAAAALATQPGTSR
ncbi:MAG TPA: mechanosensitive ion channel domain-containing protein [Acidisarcina sp.]